MAKGPGGHGASAPQMLGPQCCREEVLGGVPGTALVPGLSGVFQQAPDRLHRSGGRLTPRGPKSKPVQSPVLTESAPSAHPGDELAGKVPHFSFPSPELSALPLISAEQNALFRDKGERAFMTQTLL